MVEAKFNQQDDPLKLKKALTAKGFSLQKLQGETNIKTSDEPHLAAQFRTHLFPFNFFFIRSPLGSCGGTTASGKLGLLSVNVCRCISERSHSF
jgi:hypothetical protein